MSASITSRALLTARNFTKVNFRSLRIISSNVKHTNTSLYAFVSLIVNWCKVLGFLVLMEQMLNPWLQVPNRGKALAGWTRPSIDELGVPTEAWSKVKTNILIFFRR